MTERAKENGQRRPGISKFLTAPTAAVSESCMERSIVTARISLACSWFAAEAPRVQRPLAPLLIVLLSACASGVPARYSKPGVSVDALRHDEGECAQAALGGMNDPTFVAPYPVVDRDTVDQCMRSKGYVVGRPVLD